MITSISSFNFFFSISSSTNDFIALNGYTLLVTDNTQDCWSTTCHELSKYFQKYGVPLTIVDVMDKLKSTTASEEQMLVKKYLGLKLILVRCDLYVSWFLRVAYSRVTFFDLERVARACSGRPNDMTSIQR